MRASRRAAGGILVAGFALLFGGCSGGNACRLSGPTASGPGDVSNHFPVTVGSKWYYEVTQVPVSAGPSGPRLIRVDVTGTRPVGGTTASVFTATALDGSSAPEEALFAKGPSGVTEFAGPSVAPPLDRLYPHQVLTFPLEAGSSFEQASCTGLDYGREHVDIRSVVTVTGEESIIVPAGTFTTTRVDTHITMSVHATGGASARVDGTQSDWYAPGLGRVRSSTTISDGVSTSSQDLALKGYEVDGRRGGLTQLATLATNLAPSNSNTDMPGRPALAFDGTGHLLVSTSTVTGGWQDDSLRAQVLDADGSTVAQFAPVDRRGYGMRPAAAFNGSNHLVVSNLCAADCSTIFGQRVTPVGTALDGTSGFDITAKGSTVYAPAVASDGDGWLVAWAVYYGGLQAARISAAGAVFGPFALRPPLTPAPANPAIAFGGGVYLVAWVEGSDVLAIRVMPDGTVIDGAPIPISTAAGDKTMGGVAFDGSRFLVVWGDPRRGDTAVNGPVLDVYAARVAPDGTLVDGPPDTGGIIVNAFSGVSKVDPAVTFDGSRFVITWWIDGFYGDVGVFAARLTGDATLLDVPVSGQGLAIANPVAYGSRLVHPVAAPAAGAQTLVAWVDNIEVSGTTKSIMGAWYSW